MGPMCMSLPVTQPRTQPQPQLQLQTEQIAILCGSTYKTVTPPALCVDPSAKPLTIEPMQDDEATCEANADPHDALEDDADTVESLLSSLPPVDVDVGLDVNAQCADFVFDFFDFDNKSS